MDPIIETPPTTPAKAEAPPLPQFQAIACRKAQPDDLAQDPPKKGYKSAEEAAQRLAEMGKDTSDMEDMEDAYVFHQRAAPECKDAASEVSDIEDGMKGIGCGQAKSETTPAPTEPNPYEKVPTPGAQGATGVKGKKKGKTKDGGGERDAVQDGKADEVSRIPAGAQFIKDYSALHDQGCAIHDEHKGLLENPPVVEASERWAGEDADRSEEMKGMLGDLYPEVDFPDQVQNDDMPMDDQTMQAKEDDDGTDDQTMQAKADLDPDAKPGAETKDDMPDPGNTVTLADDPQDDMPFGAGYLAKVAGHIDAGQQMLNAGIKKQEHPDVKAFADEELGRLEDRKSECKDLMTENYPDHVAKAFPDAEAPASDDTPGAEVKTDEIKAVPEPEKKPDPIKAAKAAPPVKPAAKPAPRTAAESNNDLLRKMAATLEQLPSLFTAALAKAAAPVRAEPEPEPAVDPELLAALEAEQQKSAALRKQALVLNNTVTRLSRRLRSRMGVDGKKKAACECGGSCGSCRAKGYFDADSAAAKTMGAIDDAAGATLVPQAEKDEGANEFTCTCGKQFHASGDTANCPDCGLACNKLVPVLANNPALLPGTDNVAGAKRYNLYATRNGQKRLLIPGTPTQWDMMDFRIEDETGEVFDNRFWQERAPADAMLEKLTS